MKNFPARLKAAMEEKRMTQDALALKASTSQTSVGRWLNGKVMPHPKLMVDIARALGVRPAWLSDGTEPRDAPIAMTRGQPVPPPTKADDLVLRESSTRYTSAASVSDPHTPMANLSSSDLWDLVCELPDLIIGASNPMVRQRLLIDIQAAGIELRKRNQKHED